MPNFQDTGGAVFSPAHVLSLLSAFRRARVNLGLLDGGSQDGLAKLIVNKGRCSLKQRLPLDSERDALEIATLAAEWMSQQQRVRESDVYSGPATSMSRPGITASHHTATRLPGEPGLRIAQVAPLAEAVPTRFHGGTDAYVSQSS